MMKELIKHHKIAHKFLLCDQDGNMISSDYFRDKYAILLFVEDITRLSCKNILEDWRDKYALINEDLVIIVISTRKPSTNKKVKEMLHLPFLILSDPKGTVFKSYETCISILGIKKILIGSVVTFVIHDGFILYKAFSSSLIDTIPYIRSCA